MSHRAEAYRELSEHGCRFDGRSRRIVLAEDGADVVDYTFTAFLFCDQWRVGDWEVTTPEPGLAFCIHLVWSDERFALISSESEWMVFGEAAKAVTELRQEFYRQKAELLSEHFYPSKPDKSLSQ